MPFGLHALLLSLEEALLAFGCNSKGQLGVDPFGDQPQEEDDKANNITTLEDTELPEDPILPSATSKSRKRDFVSTEPDLKRRKMSMLPSNGLSYLNASTSGHSSNVL